MAGIKISELKPTLDLNDADVLPLARPGVGNGTTHKIPGSVFGKAVDVVALQNSKVAKAGDTMLGKLTLDGDPTAPLHAATMQYVNITVSNAGFVELAGDTMTGKLTLDGNPTLPLHAATMQYVDTIDGLNVSKSGDVMSGKLTLDGNPTLPLHAATMQYVDGAVSSAVGSIGKTWADFMCS